MVAGGSRLQDRVAVITGGGAGIGAACCKLFAAEGARVVVAEIDHERGRATESAIGDSGGDAHFVPCDVASESDILRLVSETIEVHGTIDILVNNAAVVVVKNALGTGLDEWDRLINVNLRGVWLCSKHILPVMLSAGKGAIVTTLRRLKPSSF